MENTLEFYPVYVFGEERAQPHNEVGKLFARIAGKKTLSTSDLIPIKALGFTVTQIPTPTNIKY
jgi:hypothetical protein